MKRLLVTVAACAAMLPAIVSAPANAQHIILHEGGVWKTFQSVTTDNELSCGMQAVTQIGDHEAMVSIKTTVNLDLYFMIVKDSWQFQSNDMKHGIHVPLSMGFDKYEYLSVTGNSYMGGKDHAFATIDFIARTHDDDNNKKATAAFLEGFGHADTMWIEFPNGNEKAWAISMKGSRGVVNKFAECIHMLPKPKATQPYDSNAANKKDERALL